MGAESCIEIVPARGRPISEAVKVFKQLREQAAYEHGHGGYTGTIAESPGLTIDPTVFYSVREAEEYLLWREPRRCRKWDNTIMVSVRTDEGELWVFGGVYSC